MWHFTNKTSYGELIIEKLGFKKEKKSYSQLKSTIKELNCNVK